MLTNSGDLRASMFYRRKAREALRNVRNLAVQSFWHALSIFYSTDMYQTEDAEYSSSRMLECIEYAPCGALRAMHM